MKNRRIFYNTHPAIISLEVFDKVKEIRQQRHRRATTGKSNMFSGLVFCNDCKQKLRVQSEETMLLCKKRLAQAEKRIGELDYLFVRIYDDNVVGKLEDERFAMMSKNYTEEQKNLKTEVKDLQQQILEQEQQAEGTYRI